MNQGNEQRRFERYAVTLKARYSMQDASADVECLIVELSPEGLRIKSPAALPFGSRLALSVEVPGDERLYTIAVEIKWQKELYGERNAACIAGGQADAAGRALLRILIEHMRARSQS